MPQYLTKNEAKQQFSLAYLEVIAAAAGLKVDHPSVDDDSVDAVIAARGLWGTRRSPRIDVQLKCTAKAKVENGVLKFALKRKNYDDLRGTNFMCPRILVVMVVPEDVDKWLDVGATASELQHASYWLSLRGRPPTKNTTAVTLQIPAVQQLDVESLRRLMEAAGGGQL